MQLGHKSAVPLPRNWFLVLLSANLLIHAGPLTADDFWARKPPAEWTLEESLKLLQDSPWARKQFVSVPRSQSGDYSVDSGVKNCDPDAILPGGNCMQPRIGLPLDPSRLPAAFPSNSDSSTFLMRWDSAAPVAQAFERLKELGALAQLANASPPPRLPADRYVVTLKILRPGALAGDAFAEFFGGQPPPKVSLKTEHGSAAPAEIEHSGAGAGAAVHFFFPREAAGQALLRAPQESAQFSVQTQRYVVKCKFKLVFGLLR